MAITKAWGPTSLLFSNILVIVMLFALRHWGDSPEACLILLALANLACGTLVFFPSITGSRTAPWSVRNASSILIWSCCYSISFGMFTLYPKLMSLSDLIVAESVGPTLAVVLSGDWLKEGSRYRKLAFNVCAISLLLALAFLKRGESHGSILPMIICMFCFLGSNVSARIVAQSGPAFWGQTRVALINGILLAGFILFCKFDVTQDWQSHLFSGALLGVGVLLTQGSYLFGISTTAPFLSALLISTSVPLSLASEALLHLRTIGTAEIALALVYCAVVGWNRYCT